MNRAANYSSSTDGALLQCYPSGKAYHSGQVELSCVWQLTRQRETTQ